MTRRAALSSLVVPLFSALGCSRDETALTSVEKQAPLFMEWERSIRLSPKQEEIKRAALSALPAPCCGDQNAYTCCCPCNLSRTIWGLSNYLIARKQADVAEVRARAAAWIEFVNREGFSGRACYSGGCPRPFQHDGCGGMKPDRLVL